MKRIQYTRLLLALSCLLLLTACNSASTTQVDTQQEQAQVEVQSETQKESVYALESDSHAAALLTAVSGTYEELFPVLLQEQYDSEWLNASAAVVGEDNAAGAVELLKGSMAGTVIGQEAMDAYAADSDAAAFNCDFTGGVATITFDGNTISGNDENGTEVFSYQYSYVGYEESLDFYEFKTDDANAGEWTYFVLRGDTPFTTYHIEFRYGSDLDDLLNFTEGAYAYWMAAGIIENADEEMAKDSIDLFCTENLQG